MPDWLLSESSTKPRISHSLHRYSRGRPVGKPTHGNENKYIYCSCLHRFLTAKDCHLSIVRVHCVTHYGGWHFIIPLSFAQSLGNFPVLRRIAHCGLSEFPTVQGKENLESSFPKSKLPTKCNQCYVALWAQLWVFGFLAKCWMQCAGNLSCLLVL